VKNNNKFNVLDLFSGCGGLSAGFLNEGYNIIAGIDLNDEAIETFNYNFPGSEGIVADLSDIDLFESQFFKSLLKYKINVIVGGPPCQGFSIAGKRIMNDPRNKLYRAYFNFIKSFNPEIVLMENVPTLVNMYNGAVFNNIISDLEEFGYHVKHFILNSADYGVPQLRKRVFILGVKNGRKFYLPKPDTVFNHITTKMAISDLPLLENELGTDVAYYPVDSETDYQKAMRNGSVKLFNHWKVEHKQKTIDIIKLVPDGGNYKNLPVELQQTRKVNIAWTRMNSKKPCFTIDAGHNHHFHYKANRVPTVRECARIQSFPDTFRFFGKKTSQYRQVGNAVPPILAGKIARSIIEVL